MKIDSARAQFFDAKAVPLARDLEIEPAECWEIGAPGARQPDQDFLTRHRVAEPS
jgi:hypothetical protein